MLLTKKSLWKILFMPVLYFIVGTIFIALGIINVLLHASPWILCWGLLMYSLIPFITWWAIYYEGKGKLLSAGHKLVRKALKPAEFIKRYNNLQSSPDLILNKPSFELLHYVAIAYESQNDKQNVLATADDMIATASAKKMTLAKLCKVSFLFSYGMTEQAEALFAEVHNQKTDYMAQAVIDGILKGDRAMALGDYTIAESYNLQLLERKFPKLDNLSLLVVHHTLGELYEKTQKIEKALEHYRYCADNGGETALRESAKAALERLQAE